MAEPLSTPGEEEKRGDPALTDDASSQSSMGAPPNAVCPSCGVPLETLGSIGALCPSCLLGAGLNSAPRAPEATPLRVDVPLANDTGASVASSTPPIAAAPETVVLLQSTDSNSGGGPLPATRRIRDARVFHHYEVATRPDGSLWELGRGAMGVTYKAVDVNLRRAVALKVINGEFLHRSLARERFVREARAAAQLRHPNIASVYHLGRRDDEHFYAMEFIDGETLDHFVRRQGRLEPALALEITAQVAGALAAAQGQGLVHRDIKPSNLMLVHASECGAEPSPVGVPRSSSGGQRSAARTGTPSNLPCVKVIDFGVVKWTAGPSDEDDAVSADLTGGGTVGTPSFASPEQLTPGSEVDFRSDLYSLGCTLWFMLTGKPPFLGDPLGVVSQHLSKDPPFHELDDIGAPPELTDLLAIMLAKDPEDRHASHAELLGDINTVLGALGARPGSPPRSLAGQAARPPQPRRRRSGRPARGERLLVLIVGAIALGALWLALRPRRPENPKPATDTSAGLSALDGSHGIAASAASAPAKSVAVLPFENLADPGIPAIDYLGDALAEDITTQLAGAGSELRVISRFSTMRFKNSTLPPAEIARELGVGALLTGSVRKEAGGPDGRNENAKLRVHVELTEAATQRLVWSSTYDEQSLGQLVELQREVADRIAEVMHAKSPAWRGTASEPKPAQSAAAYDLYLQGREAYYLYRKAGNERAIEKFRQTIALDPTFALAYAGLADALSQRVYRWESPESELAQAEEAARRAIALDPKGADGYKALGLVELIYGENEKSIETNRRAIKLNPNLVGAIGNIGAALRGLGRLDEALGWMKKAIVLDPVNPNWHCAAADTAMFLLDDEFAAVEYRRALVVERNYIPAMLGLIHLHLLQGQTELARQECESFRARTPAENARPLQLAALIEFYAGDFAKADKLYTELLQANRTAGAREFYGSVSYLSAVGLSRLRTGDVAGGQALLSEAALNDQEATRRRQPGGDLDAQLDLAAVWATLGQRDRAMSQLKAARPGSLIGLRTFDRDPRFNSLSSDPVFRDFLADAKSSLDSMRAREQAAELR